MTKGGKPYNYEHPLEALYLATPSSRYQKSSRPFPDVLPLITYEPQDAIHKVDQAGRICFRNHVFRIDKTFRHQPVTLRSGQEDGAFDILFCKQKIARLTFAVIIHVKELLCYLSPRYLQAKEHFYFSLTGSPAV